VAALASPLSPPAASSSSSSASARSSPSSAASPAASDAASPAPARAATSPPPIALTLENFLRPPGEDRGDGGLRITLAVAGFSPDQLQVTVEDRHLVIAGKREGAAGKAEDAYLHRGIAARGFIRSFVLADGMQVDAALLEHGLLHIDLARPEPAKRVLTIPIRTSV
jgi:hypothetical protein